MINVKYIPLTQDEVAFIKIAIRNQECVENNSTFNNYPVTAAVYYIEQRTKAIENLLKKLECQFDGESNRGDHAI